MKFKFFSVIFLLSTFSLIAETFDERLASTLQSSESKVLISQIHFFHPLMWATIGSAVTYIGSSLYHADMDPTVKKCLLTLLVGTISYHLAREVRLDRIEQLYRLCEDNCGVF